MSEQEMAYVAALKRYLEQVNALQAAHATYVATRKAHVLSLENEDPPRGTPEEWAIWAALVDMARDMES